MVLTNIYAEAHDWEAAKGSIDQLKEKTSSSFVVARQNRRGLNLVVHFQCDKAGSPYYMMKNSARTQKRKSPGSKGLKCCGCTAKPKISGKICEKYEGLLGLKAFDGEARCCVWI